MANEVASIASAIAASCSAIAAVTIMVIQRRNMIDSACPEIVLEGWARKTKTVGDNTYDLLTFSKVANTGKGSALHVYINAINDLNNRPLTSFSTERISIIPSENESEVNGEITLWWKNVAEHGMLPINITIYCWSTQNVRYETTYKLMASELDKGHIFIGGGEVAPGIILTTRSTKSVSVRRLKFNKVLAKTPLVGKYFSK